VAFASFTGLVTGAVLFKAHVYTGSGNQYRLVSVTEPGEVAIFKFSDSVINDLIATGAARGPLAALFAFRELFVNSLQAFIPPDLSILPPTQECP
jgi:hypothetical protein